MGSNTLNTITTPKTVEADDVNQLITAITGDFLPRNVSSGAIEDGQHSLGRLATQWKNLYAQNLFINGNLFDPDASGAGIDSANAIVSGATRNGSDQPDFIRASGSGASATILAATTNLQITANSTSVTVAVDLSITSLTTAPGSNNTCAIDDASLTDQLSSKYIGEHESNPITIDAAGTEITDRIGQYVCLKAGTEYMLAYVESATTLRNVYRGFFFDDSGDPIVRETLADNDTLTLMSLGWVFLQNDGVTVDVSYKSPIWSFDEPASPDIDDYWFDLNNRVWKRYSGSDFVTIDRMLIGLVVIDSTNCVASRSFDFTKSFSDFISLDVERADNTTVRTKETRSIVSVYGQTNEYYANTLLWDIATDLESGLTEASTTLYYLYVTQDGEPVISDEHPYNREHDLKGWYHPYHTWRYVGVAYNDGSSNITAANSKNSKEEKRLEEITSSDVFLALPNVHSYKVTLVGGGAGGAGDAGTLQNGSSGGTTSFASFFSATGGAGGIFTSSAPEVNGGLGGNGSGGDINIGGGDGHNGSGIQAGNGGDSTLGGGGRAGLTSSGDNAGQNGNGYGAGGGAAAVNSGAQNTGGGGAAGTAIRILKAIYGAISVTIGNGGTGGGSGSGKAGNGSGGICKVEY